MFSARKAEVNIHAHSLRHGYATHLLEKGAHIKAVQELLGHSRIATAEAYLSLLPKHLRETVDLLDSASEKNPNNIPIIPHLPKLISTKPTDDIKITILDANNNYCMDDEGNTFEIE